MVKVEKRTRDSRNEKRISMEDFEVGSSLAKYIFVYMYVLGVYIEKDGRRVWRVVSEGH